MRGYMLPDRLTGQGCGDRFNTMLTASPSLARAARKLGLSAPDSSAPNRANVRKPCIRVFCICCGPYFGVKRVGGHHRLPIPF